MGNTSFWSDISYQYRFHSENDIAKEALDPSPVIDDNENIIVRYDGCCGWTISLTRLEDNARKDSRFYSWMYSTRVDFN
jgi:hypothetical protein